MANSQCIENRRVLIILHSFLPPMNDRMFRNKPYSQCIECVATDKFRCQKCTGKILDTISQFSSVRNLKRLHISTHINFRVRQASTASKDVVSSVVKTLYEKWMDDARIKKLSKSSYASWPRKTRNLDWKIATNNCSPPKFQRWEKKLIDKLLNRKKHIQRNYSCVSDLKS